MTKLCDNCGYLAKEVSYNCPKCKVLFVEGSEKSEEPLGERFTLKGLYQPSAKSRFFNSRAFMLNSLVSVGSLLILTLFYNLREFLNRFPSPANTFILACMVLTMLYFSNHPHEVDTYIGAPYEYFKNREYYRILTSGFMHLNFMHIFFNFLALYSFGGGAERLLRSYFPTNGSFLYLLIFLIGVLLSSLPTFRRERNNPYYRSLGSSGAVSLVLGLYLAYNPHSMVLLFFIPMEGWVFLLAYLALSFYFSFRESKRADKLLSFGGSNPIGHLTHFTGGVIGVAIALLLLLI